MKLLLSLLCVYGCLVATLAEIAVPELIPRLSSVFQSNIQQRIELTGSGFQNGMSFAFDPPLKAQKDYALYIVNDHLARLQLTTGRMWRSEPGQLRVKTVTIDHKVHVLGGEDGIVIANILAGAIVNEESGGYGGNAYGGDSGSVYGDVHDANDDNNYNAGDDYYANDDGGDVHYANGSDDFTYDDDYHNKDDGETHEKCDDSCQFAMDGVCDDEFQGFTDSYGFFNTFDTDTTDATTTTTTDTTTTDTTSTTDITTPSKRLRHRVPPSHTPTRPITTTTAPTTISTTTPPTAATTTTTIPPTSTPPTTTAAPVSGWNGDNRKAPQDATYLCARGTDCKDCSVSSSGSNTGGGGTVGGSVDNGGNSTPRSGVPVTCSNTCMYARDGVCDDPRGTKYCVIGTDCQDCGVVDLNNARATNSTTTSTDDGWWDDDDNMPPVLPPSNPRTPRKVKRVSSKQRKQYLKTFLYVMLVAVPLVILLFAIVCSCMYSSSSSSSSSTSSKHTNNTDTKAKTTTTSTKAVVEGGEIELAGNFPAVVATGGVTFV